MAYRLAYKHDEKGNAIEGNLKSLIEAVSNGCDVKVLVEDDKRGLYIFKTDFVFVNGGFVCAQNPYGGVSTIPDTDGTLKWNDDILYNWMVIACTKGYLDITRPMVGSVERCPGKEHTREYHSMTWFIDK